MRIIIFFAVFLCPILTTTQAHSQELGADEIASRASRVSYYQGLDGRSEVTMVIADSQGRQRQRAMTILRKNIGEGGEQRYYVYFHKPADVRGMSYIVWKHAGKDDDRWLYLPALDLVKRIAASDKRSSFAGSTFFYEDISGRSVELDTHELVKKEDGYYELKNTPRDPGSVEFSYYTVKIDASNFVPLRAEYYDKEGKLYRIIEALEVSEIQGFATITKMKAADLNSGGSTVAEFSGISYNVGLGEDIFTERYLRKPPIQWLKE